MTPQRRQHQAAPVRLAEGWIGICATCGWVSREYGSHRRAAAESASHAANAAECLGQAFRRPAPRSARRPRARGCRAGGAG